MSDDSKHWIAGAIKHHGAFKAEAKQHGMSTAEFASHVHANPGKFSTTTKRRAALAKTLRSFNR